MNKVIAVQLNDDQIEVKESKSCSPHDSFLDPSKPLTHWEFAMQLYQKPTTIAFFNDLEKILTQEIPVTFSKIAHGNKEDYAPGSQHKTTEQTLKSNVDSSIVNLFRFTNFLKRHMRDSELAKDLAMLFITHGLTDSLAALKEELTTLSPSILERLNKELSVYLPLLTSTSQHFYNNVTLLHYTLIMDMDDLIKDALEQPRAIEWKLQKTLYNVYSDGALHWTDTDEDLSDDDYIDITLKKGFNALHIAITLGNIDHIKRCLDKATEDASDKHDDWLTLLAIPESIQSPQLKTPSDLVYQSELEDEDLAELIKDALYDDPELNHTLKKHLGLTLDNAIPASIQSRRFILLSLLAEGLNSHTLLEEITDEHKEQCIQVYISDLKIPYKNTEHHAVDLDDIDTDFIYYRYWIDWTGDSYTHDQQMLRQALGITRQDLLLIAIKENRYDLAHLFLTELLQDIETDKALPSDIDLHKLSGYIAKTCKKLNAGQAQLRGRIMQVAKDYSTISKQLPSSEVNPVKNRADIARLSKLAHQEHETQLRYDMAKLFIEHWNNYESKLEKVLIANHLLEEKDLPLASPKLESKRSQKRHRQRANKLKRKKTVQVQNNWSRLVQQCIQHHRLKSVIKPYLDNQSRIAEQYHRLASQLRKTDNINKALQQQHQEKLTTKWQLIAQKCQQRDHHYQALQLQHHHLLRTKWQVLSQKQQQHYNHQEAMKDYQSQHSTQAKLQKLAYKKLFINRLITPLQAQWRGYNVRNHWNKHLISLIREARTETQRYKSAYNETRDKLIADRSIVFDARTALRQETSKAARQHSNWKQQCVQLSKERDEFEEALGKSNNHAGELEESLTQSQTRCSQLEHAYQQQTTIFEHRLQEATQAFQAQHAQQFLSRQLRTIQYPDGQHILNGDFLGDNAHGIISHQYPNGYNQTELWQHGHFFMPLPFDH